LETLCYTACLLQPPESAPLTQGQQHITIHHHHHHPPSPCCSSHCCHGNLLLSSTPPVSTFVRGSCQHRCRPCTLPHRRHHSQTVPPTTVPTGCALPAVLPQPGRTWQTALCSLKMAWLAGVRRSRARLSRRTSWLTVPNSSPFSAAAAMSAWRKQQQQQQQDHRQDMETDHMLTWQV
jgi:hypothetical protein